MVQLKHNLITKSSNIRYDNLFAVFVNLCRASPTSRSASRRDTCTVSAAGWPSLCCPQPHCGCENDKQRSSNVLLLTVIRLAGISLICLPLNPICLWAWDRPTSSWSPASAAGRSRWSCVWLGIAGTLRICWRTPGQTQPNPTHAGFKYF